LRIAFIGISSVTKIAAENFIENGHEVIIIETNKEKIDELSEKLDCGFIHGNGTKLDILKEVDPVKTDFLICITNDDHSNIIASLLANSLKFKTIITVIEDKELESICFELGLKGTVIPAKTISNYFQELIRGRDIFELRNVLKNEINLSSFTASKDHAMKVKDFKLPENARIVWLHRKDSFIFTDPDTEIKEKDEVVIATHSDHLDEIKKQFKPNKEN
jgi:trk system potassium uptake protein TrkA